MRVGHDADPDAAILAKILDGVAGMSMDVTPQGLKLVELAPGVTRDEVQGKTGVALRD